MLALLACRRAPAPQRRADPAWDRVAFALPLVRQEYPELLEAGDFSRVPALVGVLDGAAASLQRAAGAHARAAGPDVTRELRDVRADVQRHAPPRTVSAKCRRAVLELIAGGDVVPRLPPIPDLQRWPP
ncbi:MAG: hypothetical protein ABUS79_31840, partial [Pseudomonadota bacterium]